MQRTLRIVLTLAGLLVAPIAYAQAADVNNAQSVSWVVSPDHAQIDGYTVELLRPDGTTLQTLDAGKPICSATVPCVYALNVQPVAFGVGYTVRVRARAATAVSDWSVSVNKFNRVPGKPGVVTIQ